jgi:hypothetical protein
MDHYELAVEMAMTHLAELRRQADRWRLARRILPGRTAGPRWNRAPGSPSVLGRGGQATMMGHHHEPGVFDAGHCRACARQAGLLDHYERVQQDEATLRQAHRWALAASRRASIALWSSGTALLLAAVALLTR